MLESHSSSLKETTRFIVEIPAFAATRSSSSNHPSTAREDPFRLGGVGDIEPKGPSPIAVLGRRGLRRREIEIRDRHPRAFAHQRPHDGEPDAAARPGHQGTPPLQQLMPRRAASRSVSSRTPIVAPTLPKV